MVEIIGHDYIGCLGCIPEVDERFQDLDPPIRLFLLDLVDDNTIKLTGFCPEYFVDMDAQLAPETACRDENGLPRVVVITMHRTS